MEFEKIYAVAIDIYEAILAAWNAVLRAILLDSLSQCQQDVKQL